MNNLYGVVILDIVGSRKVKRRAELQCKLEGHIDWINKKYSAILISPISITLGDEWQIITSNPSECYNFIQEFQQLLWQDDIELYAGIGIGDISTEINEKIGKMDGPCFHQARKAINIAKGGIELRKKYILSKRNRIYFQTEEEHMNTTSYLPFADFIDEVAVACEPRIDFIGKTGNKLQEYSFSVMSNPNRRYPGELEREHLILKDLVNVVIENNEILKSKMTRGQKKAFVDYQRYGSYRKMQEAYMNEMSSAYSIGNISEKLNSSEYFTIQRNLQVVKILLERYCYFRSVLT